MLFSTKCPCLISTMWAEWLSFPPFPISYRPSTTPHVFAVYFNWICNYMRDPRQTFSALETMTTNGLVLWRLVLWTRFSPGSNVYLDLRHAKSSMWSSRVGDASFFMSISKPTAARRITKNPDSMLLVSIRCIYQARFAASRNPNVWE